MNISVIQDQMRRLAVEAKSVVGAKDLTTAQKRARLDLIESEIKQHSDEIAMLKQAQQYVGGGEAPRPGEPGFDPASGSMNPAMLGFKDGVNPADPTGYVTQGAESVGFVHLKSQARAIASRLIQNARADADGQKAVLTEGSVVTGVTIDPTPIPLGRPAGSLLDVLPAVKTPANYRYIRQTARTNNAAVVAPGATKPTSVYTIESINGSLQVVAHLSEPVDTYMSEDAGPALEAFLQNELDYGLSLAVEALVQTAVTGASGIGTQAFDTDLITTSRTAITALQIAGAQPGFWFMHPSDWQTFELQKDAYGRFYKTGDNAPVELAGRRLWSAPVVCSVQATTGTAILFGEGSARLATDGSVRMRWSDQDGTDFETNQMRARLESRYNPDVLRPWAIVDVALAAV